MRRIKTLGLVGVGLIGGSFVAALKRAGSNAIVRGFDRDAGAVERAVALGVIDQAAESAADAARGAELVVVAVPVRAIGPVLHDIASTLAPDAVVTDVGSTKTEVVREARAGMRDRFARFVPAHPIAGREASGVDAASPDLFRGARVVVTPVPETAEDAVALVRQCWEMAGAKVATLAPDAHDRVFAAVSHLPHVLSFALVSELAAREESAELFSFAAGGFRDFTRIAASSPEMWRDIALQNREALLAEVDRYAAHLAVFRELIAAGDGAGLLRLMTEARNARHGWTGAPKRATTPE